MEKLTLSIKGLAPILVHNGQLSDPTNEHTRALAAAVKAAKAKKTDVAHAEVYKAEFMGGLYLDEKLEPCVPGEMLEAMLCAGAKVTRQGKEVKAGIIVDGVFPLEYKGPRDPESLWEAKFYKTMGVRIGKVRVMRTRPMFTGWACSFDVHYNPAIVNARSVREFAIKAGAECGIGDYRPRYGRFEVV